jgi:hypothetical protein
VKPSAFAYHDPRGSDDLMALLARLAGKHLEWLKTIKA